MTIATDLPPGVPLISPTAVINLACSAPGLVVSIDPITGALAARARTELCQELRDRYGWAGARAASALLHLPQMRPDVVALAVCASDMAVDIWLLWPGRQPCSLSWSNSGTAPASAPLFDKEPGYCEPPPLIVLAHREHPAGDPQSSPARTIH